MTNRHFLLLVFGITFASVASAVNFVDQPKGCVTAKSSESWCAVRALGRLEFHVGDAEIHLSRETAMMWRQPPGKALEIELVKGSLFLHNEKQAKVEVKHGQVKILAQGDVWLQQRLSRQLSVVNLQGDLRVQSEYFVTGLGSEQVLPAGFSNWFGGLNSDGKIEQGILQPVLAADFLPEWNRVCHWPKARAAEALKIYRQLWHENNVVAAALYSEVVQRRMASIEEAQSAEARRREHAEQEKQKLRQMFRARYDLTDVP